MPRSDLAGPSRISIVSSTDGSSMSTGWKRRSSAASFSMLRRYSSMVVAPMTRISPRASAGFSMFDASIEPSAAPAPTTVCSSSMNRIRSSPWSVTSSITDLRRSSNSPRYFVPATMPARSSTTRRFPASVSGTSSLTIRWAMPSAIAVFPDARVADQHRVVLGAPGEDLDRLLDLVGAADHRVELALASRFGEVAAVLVERLRLAGGPPALVSLRDAADHGSAQRGVRQAEARQQTPGVRLRVPCQREQHVLGSEIRRVQLAHLVVRPEQRGFGLG